MSDGIREQLSALVDDELDDVERPLLLGRLQRDSELRECLGRYELIGEVMRGSGHSAALGVAGRVQQALLQEAPTVTVAKPGVPVMTWWKPVAGFAVAASVALVAVLSVSSLRESSTETVPALAIGEDTPTVARVSDEQWDRIEPQVDKRLSGYLVNHSEYAGNRGVHGVMPYVRIVGYDNNSQ